MLTIQENYNFELFNPRRKTQNSDKTTAEFAKSKNIEFYFENNKFFLLFTSEFKVELLSKDFIMNLLILSNEIKLESITLFINRMNKSFGKIVQGILTIGFKIEDSNYEEVSNDTQYSIFKLDLSSQKEESGDSIEEIDF